MIYIAQIKERRTGGNHVDTRTTSNRFVKSVHLMVRHQVKNLVIRVRFSYRLQTQ